jgi:hypothetical protein
VKTCPFCAEEIQDGAVKCRYCGEFLDGRASSGLPPRGAYAGYYGWGYEYRSPIAILGLPLLHIAQGYDARTGRPRVARGIIAVGNVAIGVLALGGVSLGGLTIGGVSLGVLALGGLAAGGIAFGGLAVGILLAVGGLAISAAYALGGLALAPHAIGGQGVDPAFERLLESWFPGVHGD